MRRQRSKTTTLHLTLNTSKSVFHNWSSTSSRGSWCTLEQCLTPTGVLWNVRATGNKWWHWRLLWVLFAKCCVFGPQSGAPPHSSFLCAMISAELRVSMDVQWSQISSLRILQLLFIRRCHSQHVYMIPLCNVGNTWSMAVWSQFSLLIVRISFLPCNYVRNGAAWIKA